METFAPAPPTSSRRTPSRLGGIVGIAALMLVAVYFPIHASTEAEEITGKPHATAELKTGLARPTAGLMEPAVSSTPMPPQTGYIEAGSVVCGSFLVHWAIAQAVYNRTEEMKPLLAAKVINEMFGHPENYVSGLPDAECVRLQKRLDNVKVLPGKGLPEFKFRGTSYSALKGTIKNY